MNNLETMREAFPAQGPTIDAQDIVWERAQSRAGSIRRKQRAKRAVASATICGVLVLGGLSLGPKGYAVYRLNQIAGSVGDVRSAILEDYRVDAKGTLELRSRTTYADGRWRIERKGEVQVFENGLLRTYEPLSDRVVHLKAPHGPFGYNPSGFSVKAMLADIARWRWRQSISFGTEHYKGARVDKVTLTDDSLRDRIVVLADPKTHFPIEYRSEESSATGWRVRGVTKPSFNVNVAPETFQLHVPAGTKVVDLDKEREAWKKKLETPIGTLKFGEATVAVREIAVNSRGHVFIIYTNGESVADRDRQANAVRDKNPELAMRLHEATVRPAWSVVDDLGTEYLVAQSSLQPYVASPNPDWDGGIVLESGEILQGAWLLPAQTALWKARKITLKAEVYVKGSKIEQTLTNRFDAPSAVLLPDWIHQCQIGPREARDIFSEERRTRRPLLRANDDLAAVEASLRADLADILEQEARGQNYAKGTIYFELYQVLLKTGKRGEALEFLRLAANEPTYPNQYPSDAIREALAKEDL